MVVSGLRLSLPNGQHNRGGFLEFAADVAGVAVWEVGSLHHQDVGDAFVGSAPLCLSVCTGVGCRSG